MSDSVPGTDVPAEAAVAGEDTAEAVPEDDAYETPVPAPLGVARTPTGDADVDPALERLGDVDHLTTDGHVEVYEDVHRRLRDALTALDARPGPPVPPAPARRPVSTPR